MDFLFPATVTTPLDRFAFLFLLLILYSFLGWCGEMVYCSLAHWRLCEKRGFLNGPLCPIYGHGALLVLLILRGGCGSPVLTFLLGGLLTTALEYVTSWAMEKLFHMRWWDYSNRFCNLGGRVCLLNSTLFGLASVALCHWLSPIVNAWILGLFDLGVAVPLAAVLLVLYLADIVLSVRSAIQIGSRLAKLHAIQEEFSRKLEELRAEQQRVLETQLEKLSQGRERLGEGIAAARGAAGGGAGGPGAQGGKAARGPGAAGGGPRRRRGGGGSPGRPGRSGPSIPAGAPGGAPGRVRPAPGADEGRGPAPGPGAVRGPGLLRAPSDAGLPQAPLPPPQRRAEKAA